MFTYETSGNGYTVTIHHGSRSCFMQGDDAAQLLEWLDACENQQQVQDVLSLYSPIMQPTQNAAASHSERGA